MDMLYDLTKVRDRRSRVDDLHLVFYVEKEVLEEHA